MTGAALELAGLVGLVCGRVSRLRYVGREGALAVVVVSEHDFGGPVLTVAIPLGVDADSEAWRVYARFYALAWWGVRFNSARNHEKAVDLSKRVGAAFEGLLDSKTAARFAFWRGVTMLGEVGEIGEVWQ